MRTLEPAHVLDDSDHGNVDALKHLRAAQCVADGNFLRRRHDDRTLHVRRLDERELRVTCTGRQVDDEEVQLTPRDVAQKLIDDFHHDRTAPNRRLIALDQKAEADELHAMRLERNDLLVHDRRRRVDAHHPRHVRAVHVRIHQPDAPTRLRNRDGKIGRKRGFADSALPARNRDNVTELRIRDGLLRHTLHFSTPRPSDGQAAAVRKVADV